MKLKTKKPPAVSTKNGKLYIAGRLIGEVVDVNLEYSLRDLYGATPAMMMATGEINVTLRCFATTKQSRRK